MAGLLGNSFDDPQSQMILGLAQGLLSSNGSQGLAAGLGNMQAVQQNQIKNKLINAQLANYQSEIDARSLAATAQQRKAQALPGLFTTSPPSGDLTATPTIGSNQPSRPVINYQAALAAGYTPKEIEALAGLPNLGRPEVARTMTGLGAGGVESEQAYDKFGERVGSAVDKFRAPTAINQGNQTTLIDPYTQKPVASFPILQSPDSVASNSVSIRGQNMTDARSRDALDATKLKPFPVTDANGKQVLVQQDRLGNLTPVTGYTPAGAEAKPLTEGQSKSLLFGTRLKAANDIFDELAQQGVNTSTIGSQAPLIGGLVTALSGEDNQKLEQVKRNFLTGLLRLESGAAIGQDEFAMANKQYFPQIGDGPQVIEQKRKNRELAARGILSDVPNADKRVADLIGAAPTSATPKGNTIDALPSVSSSKKGDRIKDTSTGKILQFNGLQWRPE
jgi:hypothetical protein